MTKLREMSDLGNWLTHMAREVHMDERAGVVTAKLTFGAFTEVGTARKHPADEWSPLVGEWLAVSRAMSRMAKKIGSSANRMVAAAEVKPFNIPSVNVQVVKDGKVRYSTDNLLGVKDDPYQLSHRLVDVNERLDRFLQPKAPK